MSDLDQPNGRDFAIDMMATQYGLDSDDVDRIEAECKARGVTLMTSADWRIQFDLVKLERDAFNPPRRIDTEN